MISCRDLLKRLITTISPVTTRISLVRPGTPIRGRDVREATFTGAPLSVGL